MKRKLKKYLLIAEFILRGLGTAMGVIAVFISILTLVEINISNDINLNKLIYPISLSVFLFLISIFILLATKKSKESLRLLGEILNNETDELFHS
jgi:hypothetical protein